ncbi:unnamed protein product [Leptidea sinapis]|uniref:Uncharacterized protein n=2 Tax=Leptidea sinapis TaxID=189913 RepID=A0A5E4Q4Q8_9NEOP|nr:unnamed protein product [Leptidea sinapis]
MNFSKIFIFVFACILAFSSAAPKWKLSEWDKTFETGSSRLHLQCKLLALSIIIYIIINYLSSFSPAFWHSPLQRLNGNCSRKLSEWDKTFEMGSSKLDRQYKL